MATRNHSDARAGSRHAIHNLSYPDAANRAAGTNETNSIVVDADNVYQVALQLDDNTLWLLTDTTPITWVGLGAAGTSTDTLDNAYDNFGALPALVTVDGSEGQGDLNFTVSGARSLIVDLSGCTPSADGFIVQDGTDGLSLTHQGANTLALVGNFESMALGTNAAASVIAGTTLTLQGTTVAIDGAVTVDDDLTLTGGGLITTDSDGLLRIAAHGTGYNAIGSAGVTSHSLNSGDDLLVSGDLEADGEAYLDAGLTVGSDITLTSGGTITTSSDGNLILTADGSGFVVVGGGSTVHGLATGQDLLVSGFLEVQGEAYFDQYTNFADDIALAGGGTITTSSDGLLRLAPDGTGYTAIGLTGTTSHSLDSGDDLLVSGDLEVDGAAYFDGSVGFSGDLTLTGGGLITTDSDGLLRIAAHGTGYNIFGFSATTSHSLTGDGDLLVGGDFEVDGWSYFDAPIVFGAQGTIQDNAAQTNDALQITVGTNSNSLIICQTADVGYDFAHAAATDPTLYLQSAAQSATEFISFRHDQTDMRVDIGEGSIIHFHESTVTIADESSIALPSSTASNDTAGFGRVQMTDEFGSGMEFADFAWDENGSVTLLSNTTNVANSDSDGNMCIYGSGGVIYLKNRLGSSSRVLFDVHYHQGFSTPV